MIKLFDTDMEHRPKGPLLRFLMPCLVLVVASSSAHARECAGVSFPEQFQAQSAALKLNGLGLRLATFLKVKVYVAALYVPQPSKDAESLLSPTVQKELILHFVRGVDRADLNKAWDEGFENNAGSGLSSLKGRIETFKGMMVDMKSGQKLRLAYTPGAGVTVDVNDMTKGAVAGDDFAKVLFAIWLGNNPPNVELKNGLLGGLCG